jgi:hypothetical protein
MTPTPIFERYILQARCGWEAGVRAGGAPRGYPPLPSEEKETLFLRMIANPLTANDSYARSGILRANSQRDGCSVRREGRAIASVATHAAAPGMPFLSPRMSLGGLLIRQEYQGPIP